MDSSLLAQRFWAIILKSYTYTEVERLAHYAAVIERSQQWQKHDPQ